MSARPSPLKGPALLRARLIAYPLASCLIAGTAIVDVLHSSVPNWSHLGVLLIFVGGMVVGAHLRADQAEGHGATPITLALAYAALLNTDMPHGNGSRGYGFGLLTAIAGLVAAAVLSPGTGVARRARLTTVSPAIISVAIAALAYWAVPAIDHRSAAEKYNTWLHTPWWTAATMVIAVAVGVTTYAGMRKSIRESFMPGFPRTPGEAAAVAASIVVTAVAVALGCGVLGALAIPLMTVPLISMFLALRRRVHAVATRAQTINALARLVELSGYSPPGHAARVADLARRVGVAIDLPRHEMPALEEAALIHDIGHVMLPKAIPDGTTIDLAPSDQQAIATEGARIIQAGEVFEDAAKVLRAQSTQFRRVQELHEAVPVHSRIIKVCNAYDDICHGDPNNRDAAIERLSLGIGYEYDPYVLNALELVTARPTMQSWFVSLDHS